MNNEPETNRLAADNARLRGDLLAVATRVSHDLRTPLGGILSAAEALHEITGENPAACSLVEALLVSADELGRMIKDVGFVLKATANPLPKEALKMEDVFACALQRVEYRIVKSSAKVSQPSSWPSTKGVSIWVEMIWSIFLEDGLKRGGNPPDIQTGWRAGDSEQIFWLRAGAGVPSEQRAELFQQFDLLHRPNSGALNFAIARRLAELQGGRCGCGDDASIFFTLPL
ncbi:MAG TPA: HAMP domain-containing sensor histidine kinase [Verrucomicrobiae bacterium]|nr:HAMP domain-containing sensor histidine kinase [Verrucomicrobiae bacterium]